MANSLETKKEAVSFIELGTGIITVRHWTDKSDLSSFDVYQLEHSHAVYQKLYNYKSLRALVNFVKANQIKQSTAPCLAPAVPSDDGGGATFNRLDDAPQSSSSLQAVEPNADTCPPCHHPIHDDKGVIFLDTETTGLSDTDTIVDIALVDIDENVIFQSLVNPNKPIPKSATAVHGITDDMVADAPSFTDIYQHIDELCKGKTVVMYNANFDLRMIGQSYHQRFLPQRYHCLMIEYAKHWGDLDHHHQSYKWQKLINACTQQQIQILDVIPHRAVGDAILTARLYRQRPHWKPRRRHRQWLFNVH